ncbi:hypothetical protein ACQSSU_03115 [Micromonospora echinospora]
MEWAGLMEVLGQHRLGHDRKVLNAIEAYACAVARRAVAIRDEVQTRRERDT